MNHRRLVALDLFVSCLAISASGQQELGNEPEQVEWLWDQALGMFVHWSVDVQLGSVISHSLVGASDD